VYNIEIETPISPIMSTYSGASCRSTWSRMT
jgi:hypothetical protein